MSIDLFDARTALFLFGVSSIFIAYIFSSYIVLNKSRNWCLTTFLIGKILQTFGVIGFSLRFYLPDFLSITTGGIFLFIGFAFEIFGITSFDLVFRKKNFYTILVSTCFFIFLAIIFLNNPDYQKAINFSFAGMLYFGYGGIYFVLLSIHTKFKKWIGYTYIFFSLVFLSNIISLSLQLDNYHFLKSEGIMSFLVILTGYFVILFGSIGLLLIQREQNKNKIIKDNIELEKLNNTKDKFFSIIAHDLRGPFGSLTHLIQLLVKEQNEISPVDRKELLDTIHKSANNTCNLLENLLQWSRAESGRLPFNKSVINLHEIANTTIDLLCENICTKNLSLTINIDENDVAYADFDMIKTVFRNLISNAIKFTPKNGKININTYNLKNGTIKVSVEDNGIGIDEDSQKKIFDIQYNHSTKGTDNENGTGLGLKLCKEFVEINCGELSIYSEIDKGSTFNFTLPIK